MDSTMNMQDTSLDAYYTKVLPFLNNKQRAIMIFFLNHKNCNFTNAELSDKIGWSINRITPRVLELRNLGKLELACRRICTVTQNGACAWELTK